VLSILGFHLVAMFPDLLLRLGIPHDGWMDVFLAHISSHYAPGGTYTWLLVAAALSALYAIFLSAWLAARLAEASAGLAPGIGMGGRSLLRAQASPRTTVLAHRRYGPAGTPTVLLLHGLGASRALWAPLATELEARGHAVLVPDLLGFGESRTIGTRFRLRDHVAAVTHLLEAHAAKEVLVVGHSFGCAVAVQLAGPSANRPLVSGLVLVSPPVFRDGEQARDRLGHRGWLARRVLAGSPLASVTCGAMCLLRRPAAGLVARIADDVPERVARDSVQHTWPAYRDALMALLDDNPLPAAIGQPRAPTTVLLGDADSETPAEDVLDWPHEQVGVVVVEGTDHLLPLRRPAAVVDAIEARHSDSLW
jgi:pimeloyl-ACP methyl ester carboxylesterase